MNWKSSSTSSSSSPPPVVWACFQPQGVSPSNRQHLAAAASFGHAEAGRARASSGSPASAQRARPSFAGRSPSQNSAAPPRSPARRAKRADSSASLRAGKRSRATTGCFGPRPEAARRSPRPLPRPERSGAVRPLRPAGRASGRRSGVLAGASAREAGPCPLGRRRAARRRPRPARFGVAEARRRGQVLAVRGADPLRLEAGPDDRRRTAAGRGGGRLPVQGLSGPLLRGRDAGLRGQLRRLQPPLGLRQRHPRRPVGGEAPPRPCPPEKEKDLKQHKTPEGISPGSCFLRYSFAAFSSSAASAAASASSSF